MLKADRVNWPTIPTLSRFRFINSWYNDEKNYTNIYLRKRCIIQIKITFLKHHRIQENIPQSLSFIAAVPIPPQRQLLYTI